MTLNKLSLLKLNIQTMGVIEKTVIIKRFTISNEHNSDERYKLDNICGVDLFQKLKTVFPEFIEDFVIDNSLLGKPNLICRIYTPKETVENPNPVLHYTTYSNNRIVCGQMKVGPLVEKEVRDIQNKKTYYLDSKNAVLDPFFFLIYLPRNSDLGILLLEREMPNVEYVFGKILLRNFIKTKIKDELQINVENFIPKDFVKTLFTDGYLDELTLTSNTIPPDVADRIGVFMTENEGFKCKIIITPKDGFKQKAREYILDILDNGFHSIFGTQQETWGENERMDIKVLSRLNGQEKKISLKNPYNFRPYYKIPVSLTTNFETDYEDIKTTSLNYLKENVNPLLKFDKEDTN